MDYLLYGYAPILDPSRKNRAFLAKNTRWMRIVAASQTHMSWYMNPPLLFIALTTICLLSIPTFILFHTAGLIILGIILMFIVPSCIWASLTLWCSHHKAVPLTDAMSDVLEPMFTQQARYSTGYYRETRRAPYIIDHECAALIIDTQDKAAFDPLPDDLATFHDNSVSVMKYAMEKRHLAELEKRGLRPREHASDAKNKLDL